MDVSAALVEDAHAWEMAQRFTGALDDPSDPADHRASSPTPQAGSICLIRRATSCAALLHEGTSRR